MLELTTHRLLLRTLVPRDSVAFRTLILDKEASALAVYDQPRPTGIAEISRIVEHFAAGDELLAICLRDTSELIGFATLNRTSAPGERNLGYCIRSDQQGRGYATEACRALIEYAFTAMGLVRLVSATAEANLPSVRLLAGLGFTKVAATTASFRTTPAGDPLEFDAGQHMLERSTWEAGQCAH